MVMELVDDVATETSSDKLTRLREQLPALATTGYFNAGTNGPLPRCVHETIMAASEREFLNGRIGPKHYPSLAADMVRVRGVAASIFNAEPSEIALTHCTSDGLDIALLGLTWRPGDEVLTVQTEHVCLFSALGIIAHRFGVVIRTIDIKNGGGDVTALLERAITPRTRAIAISHVQWSTGAVMPLKEIAEMARSHNVLTVVDAAQAAGQVPIDLHDLGVDAYAMPGQKWLCGPVATGILYVRADRISEIQPTFLRFGTFDPTGYVIPPPGAARYEGEVYNPTILGQEASLLWLRDEVGLDWLYNRIKTLGERCYEGLSKIDGLTIATPRDRMAGLICFTIAGKDVKDVTAAVYELGHTIRYVDQRPGPAAVRVSTGWWCTEDEVDSLIEAIAEVAKSENGLG